MCCRLMNREQIGEVGSENAEGGNGGFRYQRTEVIEVGSRNAEVGKNETLPQK